MDIIGEILWTKGVTSRGHFLSKLNPGQSQQQPITMFGGDSTRKIWQGELSWVNPNQSQTTQDQVVHSVVCTVSTQQPGICSENWPKKLILQTIPKSFVQHIGGISSKYLQNARLVLFDLTDNLAKNHLTKVLNEGYTGCVHFPSRENKKGDIRVLILFSSPADNSYLGYIPNDQVQFIDCIRKFILQQRELLKVAIDSTIRVPAGFQGQPQQPGGTMLSSLQSNHQQQKQ